MSDEASNAQGEVVEAAEIVREYGPYSRAAHGVTYDGAEIWVATGKQLRAIDPATGECTRSIDVAADAGTTFDGKHLFQLHDGKIHRIEPKTGRILSAIAAPDGASGLAYAEGTLWVGQYRERRILQVDPSTGEVLRTISSDRFVTGVTWVDGELWHGTWEDERSDIRRIDPSDGRVQVRLAMPQGDGVSGLESNGAELFFAGGATSGKVRAIRRPRRSSR